MPEKSQLLIVDDEKINQIILTEMLNNQYDLICVDDGEACLEAVAKKTPDLILLDVNMPKLSGLEVCEKLRADEKYKNLAIIFVSALASEKERLDGYSAGGDDYVTKPFVEKELLQKITLMLEHQKDKLKLKESNSETHDALMTSLTSAAELGEVINFTRQSYGAKTMQELSNEVFSSLRGYGLEGSLLVTAFEQPQTYFGDGIDRPLEREVLTKLNAQKDRIITFAKRLVLNSPHVTLLIRNLPDDDDKVGRYRDHIAILMDALDARVEGLVGELNIQKHQQELKEVITAVQENLDIVDQQHQQLREENTQIMSSMASEIEDSFIHLGLTENQEATLQELVTATEAKTDDLFVKGLKIDEQFDDIIKKLNASLIESKPID